MAEQRPELRAALWRGREALAGAAVLILALWLGLSAFGVTRWVAVPLGLLGLGLVWTGIQRWRFVRGTGGPGIVEVDERRITYWGPLSGGTLDLDDLLRLDLDPGGRPAHWVLTPRTGQALAIPVSAQGAEALLDLFTALPGLRTEALLSALSLTEGPVVAVWQSPNVIAFPGPQRRRLN